MQGVETMLATSSRIVGAFVVGVACLIASACGQDAIVQAVSSAEDRALSVEVIGFLQTGAYDKVLALTLTEWKAKLEPELPKMRGFLPSGAGTTIKLVDARFTIVSATNAPTTRNSYLAYAVDKDDKHALAQIGFGRSDNKVWLTALYVNPLGVPAEELNAFVFSGKPAGHYLFLILAALSPITVLASLYVLYRATNVRRKWAWAIGCLFGFGLFTFDWTSGAFGFAPLNAQLFGLSVTKAGVLAPWQIGFGLPLVAYWFLLRQAHLRSIGA